MLFPCMSREIFVRTNMDKTWTAAPVPKMRLMSVPAEIMFLCAFSTFALELRLWAPFKVLVSYDSPGACASVLEVEVLLLVISWTEDASVWSPAEDFLPEQQKAPNSVSSVLRLNGETVLSVTSLSLRAVNLHHLSCILSSLGNLVNYGRFDIWSW